MPTPMDSKAASRIQSHADKSGTNQGFKSRAQSAGAKNANAAAGGGGQKSSNSGGGGGGAKSGGGGKSGGKK
ncbi:hypothetical protein BV22DRAFT_1034953 [Leucogyrophana mollusca]|uniref:Uncharacterized protein n=1 Tax=Leucogyrophana mollusca TaxID=85980 RepID=A0ACB8BFS1_9AGAM|nr:hypothetical protein BV22DRAFT_1034953 [Leucogyrophana mollusca]